MTKTSLRIYPKQNIFRRLFRAVGEISALRNTRLWSFSYFTPYKLDSSRVNYDLARQLYRNTADKYKLGAAFARPVINSTAGFMGAPHFTHADPEADRELEKVMTAWTGKLFRLNRNTLRDGDVFARIAMVRGKFSGQEVFDLQLISPEWVQPVPDPLTGSWQELVIRYPVVVNDSNGREMARYTVTETLRPNSRTIEADSGAPAEVRAKNGTEPNPWGFIPVVHFKNEAEEYQLYGCSDLEPIEPFMKVYHDIMLFATQGSKMFSRPKAKFKLKSVEKFLADNFSQDEINTGKLRFADKEIFLLQEGDDAAFITADSGLEGITTLLKFIYFCIVDVSETPEFCFGTAVQSSKASVSEQMVPFSRKIRRKRGMFEEYYQELAGLYLAMRAKMNNRRLETYQVDIGWEELSPKNDKEVAETIKTLADGLSTGVEAGLLSVDAASEFLREFIPSMLPFADPDADDDERRRIAKSFALLWRLRDGQGLEEPKQGPESGLSGEIMTPKDWQKAYKKGIPHWAVSLEPSIFAQKFIEKIKGHGKKILEIGCGNGRDSIFFARAGFNVTAIDVVPEAIKLAKANAKEAEVEVEFEVANAEKLPFKDKTFDAVFTLSVLHATNLFKSIPETARVLVPGGLLSVYIYGDTEHIQGKREVHITVDDFLELLKSNDYEIIDFYSEQENEYDEAGEKHQILVALAKKAG